MNIKKIEIDKYKKFPTRYDLQYWKNDNELWLEVSSYEFENEIMLIVKKLKEYNIESIIISTFRNNYQINLENLKYISFIKELSIDSGSYINTNSLYLLEKLETLWINNDNYGEKIDLKNLKNLKKLIVSTSCINLNGLFELPNLITLKLQRFNEIDLTKFNMMNSLTSLELVQSKVKSLNGIEKMKNLKYLTLFYSSQLLSIQKISSLKKLEYLEIRNCKKIENYKYLGKLNNLKRLSIYDCSALNDLSFINHQKKLEFVGLINTNVLDGNIEPLIKIKNHGYTNKKNFNYHQSNGKDIKKT